MSNVELTGPLVLDLNKRFDNSGLTQRQLADFANMSYGNLNAILSGRRTYVREETLAKLNKVLDRQAITTYTTDALSTVDSNVEHSTNIMNNPTNARVIPARVNALDENHWASLIAYLDSLLDAQYSGH